MKSVLLPLLLTVVITPVAQSQNPANPFYQGMQPQLVKGLEDGPANGRPKIRHAYLAAPDALAFVVDAQHLWSAPLQEYVPQPGDEIRRKRPQNYGNGKQFFWNRSIIRNGVSIGEVVGPKEDHYIPNFTLEGEALDTAWAGVSANYGLVSTDDAAYHDTATPLAVFRKTKPEMREWVGGKQQSTLRHELFLKLPRALTPGKRYTLNFGNGSPFAAPLSFVFDDTRLRTEAIQVNQVGYHPRQAAKIAHLFQWLGSGGGVDFSAFQSFLLVDNQSGKEAFRGAIQLRAAGDPQRKMAPFGTANADSGDSLPASLYELDFSAFSQPGVYRAVVPGLGSSFPFRIDEAVWTDAAKMSAHGYFNQRSGMELGPPYTKYKRPRNFAPDTWSSYLFSSSAARCAHYADGKYPEVAAVYRAAALKAMTWAEKELAQLPAAYLAGKTRGQGTVSAVLAKVRNLAAADLYRLTGDQPWHDLFLETFEIRHEEANWVYLQTKRERDSAKVELCRSELIRAAGKILGEQQKVGFRWSRRAPGDEDWKWGLFSRPEGGDVLVRAWRLTGEPRFRHGMVLAAQMGVGANPNNVVYTSGLGRNPMRNVFYHDTLCQGIEFPAGLVAFGPINPATPASGMFSQIKAVAEFFVPAHAVWPQTEFCVDTGRVHVIDEHTPDGSTGQAAYLWGSLAF